MTDDGTITNKMLLEHMQANFNRIDRRFENIDRRFETLESRVEKGFRLIHQELDDARTHREAIQIDLDATIRMQFTHQKQLAVLTGSALPEEDEY